MKTGKKRNLEKLKRKKMNWNLGKIKTDFIGPIYIYIYKIAPPAHRKCTKSPPLLKKRKKWAPQSSRYSSNTAGEYLYNFFLNVNTCERLKFS